MKKAWICILLALCMLLSACEKADGTPPIENPTPATTEGPVDYTALECHDVKRFVQRTYSFEESDRFINLYFSHEWLFKTEAAGERYTIYRNRDVIGQFYTGEYLPEPGSHWEILEEKDTEYMGLTIAEYVEQDLNAKDVFRCRYLYSYEENNETKRINITVDYTEVGENIRYELYEHVDFESIKAHTGFDTLTHLRNSHILILGNSFIGSSSVGKILQEMVNVNEKSIVVDAISRGYAKVETYTGDADLMYDIERGMYNAVFICGFYNTDQVAELGLLKAACDRSDTTLVIFPAHNESRGAIDKAASTYKDLLLLDWKNEIDLLIKQGVSKSDMCINDTHQHSTPLAGYVGAQMIYRAIFGEVPATQISDPNGIGETANQKLGSYVDSGMVYDVDYVLK